MTRIEIISCSRDLTALPQRAECGCWSFPPPESSDPYFLVSVSLRLSFASSLLLSGLFPFAVSFLFGVSDFWAHLVTPPRLFEQPLEGVAVARRQEDALSAEFRPRRGIEIRWCGFRRCGQCKAPSSDSGPVSAISRAASEATPRERQDG